MKVQFENLGYFEEIKLDGKNMGCVLCDEDPAREVGYYGKQTKVVDVAFFTDRKKKIKAGSVIETYYYPICGRIISIQ